MVVLNEILKFMVGWMVQSITHRYNDVVRVMLNKLTKEQLEATDGQGQVRRPLPSFLPSFCRYQPIDRSINP